MAHIRTTSAEQAAGDLKKVYGEAQKRAGRVSNAVMAQGLCPPVLRASWEMQEAIMWGDGPLSPADREMIALVVSSANHCEYGMHAHAHALSQRVSDEHLVGALSRDYRLARLDERARAILDFAVLVSKDVHLVSRASVQELRAHGLTDEEVLMVVQVTSFINYENRLVDALGVALESFEAVAPPSA
jgi:uncharacterized peroxidase-related enzyme